MVAAITKDLEERFGDRTGKNVHLAVAHTDNQEEADEFAKELRELFPGDRRDRDCAVVFKRQLPYRTWFISSGLL